MVGDLELGFEAMELTGGQGLTLIAYSPERGSPSADGIALLASWVAAARTAEQAAPDRADTPRGDPR